MSGGVKGIDEFGDLHMQVEDLKRENERLEHELKAYEKKDLLAHPLCDITLEDLLTHLDISSDIEHGRRKNEVKLAGEIGRLLDGLGLLHRTYNIGAAPNFFTNAADFHNWAKIITGVFARDTNAKEIVVLTAWLENT